MCEIMECVRCGATAIIEGSLMEMSSGGGVAFLSKGISIFKNIFGSGTRKINAHACLHCSHLELTVEFTDKDVNATRNLTARNRVFWIA